MKKEIVDCIQKLVKTIRKKENIGSGIIRDDVFSILQQNDCTVLYFPLGEEGEDKCDGCHLRKPVNNEMKQFVFINTSNTRERQAFSAAHELGHIWRIDEQLKNEFPDEDIDEEDSINRFAAELLMPDELFQEVMDGFLNNNLDYNGSTLGVGDFLELIVYLMNYFFVPFKSVVIRFYELGKLSDDDKERIMKYKDSDVVKEIIKSEQYTRLGIVTKMKSMDNLKEDLALAKELGVISEKKLKNIVEKFDIQNLDRVNEQDIKF